MVEFIQTVIHDANNMRCRRVRTFRFNAGRAKHGSQERPAAPDRRQGSPPRYPRTTNHAGGRAGAHIAAAPTASRKDAAQTGGKYA